MIALVVMKYGQVYMQMKLFYIVTMKYNQVLNNVRDKMKMQ